MAKNMATSSTKLPADLAALFNADELEDDLISGAGSGFAVVSIRGSKWRIKHQGEEEPILNGDGDPVPALEAVLLKASPQLSHIYYKKQYEEGDAEEPDCFSVDGVAPDPAARDKQAKACASCKHAVWGSRITESGKKSKACQDSRRMAVVPAGDIANEEHGGPMLLRVPAASLGDLAAYGKKLKSKGVAYRSLVTKIGFDMDASYPKLTFRPVRMLDESELRAVVEHLQGDAIDNILTTAAEVMSEAPVEEPVKEEESNTLELDFDDDAAAKEALAKAEAAKKKAAAEKAAKAKAAKEKAAKAKAAEEAKAKEGNSSLEDDLDAVLNGLDSLD